MCHPLREQARSHTGWWPNTASATARSPVGAKLARESGGSACINVEHATLFASKPAPTPGGGRTQSLQQPRSPVGAKLARDEIDTVPDQNKSPKSPANPTPTEPAYTPSSSYASLRLCLQLRQNPPACAPCPRVLLSFLPLPISGRV